jgi:RNA polymerase sigma-70 factor (ECF subfamily)
MAPSDPEQLYRQEASRLLAMLVVFLGDRTEAEDVLQEAFLRVQRSWDRIESPSTAGPYLRTTAFNLARTGLRRRLRPQRAPRQQDLTASPEDGLMLREDQRSVMSALAQLPERQRACVVLRYHGEAGISEIAVTLGVSENSVKTHLRRALASLEALLVEAGMGRGDSDGSGPSGHHTDGGAER